MVKCMRHADYQQTLKGKTNDELAFIIRDAAEAARVNPTGCNVGYYLDEVHYAAAEMRSRNDRIRSRFARN
jgi:hypothetical protein